MVTKFMLG